MSSFRTVNSRRNILVSPEWIETNKFENEIRLVNESGERVGRTYKGKTYRLISQRELHYTLIQRVVRYFAYALVTLPSLGLAHFLFESVRDLLKEREVIIYGMAVRSIQSNPKRRVKNRRKNRVSRPEVSRPTPPPVRSRSAQRKPTLKQATLRSPESDPRPVRKQTEPEPVDLVAKIDPVAGSNLSLPNLTHSKPAEPVNVDDQRSKTSEQTLSHPQPNQQEPGPLAAPTLPVPPLPNVTLEQENGPRLPCFSLLGLLAPPLLGKTMNYLPFEDLLAMRKVNKSWSSLLSHDRRVFNQEARLLDTLAGNESLHCIYESTMEVYEHEECDTFTHTLGDYSVILVSDQENGVKVSVIELSTAKVSVFTLDKPIKSSAIISRPDPALLLIFEEELVIKMIALSHLEELITNQVERVESTQLPDYEELNEVNNDLGLPLQVATDESLVVMRFSNFITIKDVISKQHFKFFINRLKQIILQDRKLVTLSDRECMLYSWDKKKKGDKEEWILTTDFRRTLTPTEVQWSEAVHGNAFFRPYDVLFKFATLSSSALIIAYNSGRESVNSRTRAEEGWAVGEMYDLKTGKTKELVDHYRQRGDYTLNKVVTVESRETSLLEGARYRVFGGSYRYNQWSDRGGLSRDWRGGFLGRQNELPIFVMKKIGHFVFSVHMKSAFLHSDSHFDQPKQIKLERFGRISDPFLKNSRIISMDICNSRYLFAQFGKEWDLNDGQVPRSRIWTKIFDLAPPPKLQAVVE